MTIKIQILFHLFNILLSNSSFIYLGFDWSIRKWVVGQLIMFNDVWYSCDDMIEQKTKFIFVSIVWFNVLLWIWMVIELWEGSEGYGMIRKINGEVNRIEEMGQNMIKDK